MPAARSTVPARMDGATDNARREIEEIERLVSGRRLIIATNRGPVEFHRGVDGKLAHRRGPGGVVIATA